MIEIRLATERDYPHLPAVESDAGTVFADFGLPKIAASHPTTEDYYRSLPKENLVLVATKNAEIVAFSVGLIVDSQAYLKEVSVKRSYAKQGIGRRLVKGVIQWAMTQGFHTVTLTTYRDLPFNGPFYATLGFEEFVPDDRWPELRLIREKENRTGLDIYPRVTMRLDLGNINKTEAPLSCP